MKKIKIQRKYFITSAIFGVISMLVIAMFLLTNSHKTPAQQIDKVQLCDINIACETGLECLKFEDEPKPICWQGDPCQKCDSKKCEILESFPGQVKCL
jgi:hypothetical protein